MQEVTLIAQTRISHSVGTIEEGDEFTANAVFARGLIQAGHARFKDDTSPVTGSLAGCRVVVIASGRSLTPNDVEMVRRWREENPAKRKVAVTCLTFLNAPWADYLYAADEQWWDRYGSEVDGFFAGERWTQADEARRRYPHLKLNYIQVMREQGLSKVRGIIHNGGNSGYQLVGLMFDLGCRDMVLLGFDMQRYTDGKNHHHLSYPKGFPQDSPYERWAGEFGLFAIELEKAGAKVVNASRLTALQKFKRQSLEAALAGETPLNCSIPKRAHCLLRPALTYRRDAFVKGLTAIGCKVSLEAPKHPDSNTLFVSWNRYGVNHETALAVEKAGGTVIIAENGYLGTGGSNPKYHTGDPKDRYFALALDAHNGNGRTPAGDAQRWEQLQVELQPWRSDEQGHFLVCPNRSFGMPGTVMHESWAGSTASHLRKSSDRIVKVRPHPGNEPPKEPLSDDLKGAYAMVIWSTSAGVQSLIEGVPVYQCAPHWVCEQAAQRFMGNKPLMHDEYRLKAMHKLASSQWTISEIASGEAFKRLLEVR